MANKTYKVLLEKLGGTDSTTYVGNEGELFFDPTSSTLRIADGLTPGGTTVSGGGGGGGSNVATSILDGGGSVAMFGSDLQILCTDDDITVSTRDGGDDVNIWAGDAVRVEGGDKAFDSQQSGGQVTIEGGNGASCNALDAGNGGAVTIRGGSGGTSASEVPGQGGTVTIYGGFTERPGYGGGNVLIYGGDSNDGTFGNVEIGNNDLWIFNENAKTLKCPRGLLSELGNPDLVPGARAFITNCSLTASGNFGEIATDGGSNTVPVYSDGTEWRIG